MNIDQVIKVGRGRYNCIGYDQWELHTNGRSAVAWVDKRSGKTVPTSLEELRVHHFKFERIDISTTKTTRKAVLLLCG